MSGFESILFVRTPEVENAGAFDRAIRLAKRKHLRLDVAGIAVDTLASVLPLLSSLRESEGVGEERAADLEWEEVEKLLESARHSGVTAKGHVLEGPPFQAVIRKVLVDEYGLVVKAASRIPGMREVLFGHLDRQLMRKCPCPIWIDKPEIVREYRRVLAAVDTSPVFLEPDSGSERSELNKAIMELAVEVAETEQADLDVVHVWNSPVFSRATLMPDVLAEVEEKFRVWHQQALQTAIHPYRGKVARVHLLKGVASKAIPKLSLDQSIDVIVMGTLCRTGVSGLLIGNTAETVLEQVECSVVTLKPRGFVSPVSVP